MSRTFRRCKKNKEGKYIFPFAWKYDYDKKFLTRLKTDNIEGYKSPWNKDMKKYDKKMIRHYENEYLISIKNDPERFDELNKLQKHYTTDWDWD